MARAAPHRVPRGHLIAATRHHRVADQIEPVLRRALLRALRATRLHIDLDHLAQLLEAQDAGALERGGFWQAVMADLLAAVRPAIRDAILQGGSLEAQRIGKAAPPIGVRFDLTNPEAIRAIEQQAAALVGTLTTESRAAIQALLRRGFLEGIPPRELARLIVQHLGLTPQYSTAVANYRQSQLAQGIARGVAERRAALYADRLLAYRATVIARTEVIQAEALGQQAVWRQGRAEGLLEPQQQRVWIVTPDDRLCEICAPMEDQTVGLEEWFTTGDGDKVLTPPAHPQCRCAIGLAVTE